MADLPAEFAAAMARLGAPRRFAVAVSGGADSMALAVLARAWGADMLALIVDHGLRAESADEAALVAARLAGLGVASEVLTLRGLGGAGVQAQARAARYAALGAAALASGRLYVLLGHHAGDQSETVAMRAKRGAGGAEGMAGWAARHEMVLLRPLLGVAPAALREFLLAQGVAWVEDRSNLDKRFERVRVRLAGTDAVASSPAARQAAELEAADFLARFCEFRPEGFAVLDAAAAPVAALGALIRMVGGGDYAPRQAGLARLGAALRPATLGGVRIMAAGKRGPGWVFAREPAACAAPVPACAGARWDNRFTLRIAAGPGARLGALGAQAVKFRGFNGLPSLVLRTMPCLRGPEENLAFPALADFTPPAPATAHPFRA